MRDPSRQAPPPATLSEIHEVVGDLDAARLEAILATGATVAEVEQAVAWAAGASDVMGELPRPLESRVAAVYGVPMTEAPDLDQEI